MGEKRQTEHTQANAVTVEPKSSSQRSKQKVRHDIEMICAWVSFAALVVCNVLAQTGVMGRMVKPQHSEAFTWFVPARYTDLIWAVIFVFAAVWLVRLGNDKHRARNLGKIPASLLGILFIAACVLQIAWLFCFHAVNYPATITLVFASTIVIWVLWFFSRRHDRTVWGWVPFSLWGSWLGIETITDIARAVSYYLSKDGSLSAFGQMISTIILALLLLAVACAMRWYMGDWVFGLCVLWSVLGVAIRIMDTSKITAVIVIIAESIAAALMYLPWRHLTGRLNSVDALSSAHAGAVDEQGRKSVESDGEPQSTDYPGAQEHR